ncbi:cellulose biosynthesis cyclic di-GMP-binding regulatory protein BcsB [Acetobacter peroxydans]|jgi:hypothetical protein|uniref:cellulose biosynthesis cyclic di-GMP-binding regulatory protein BcsB n=1 Tax=Acetobacter peroxydans TaxID=104098 RepID=UPI002354B9FB|nr:cellulose biosynthesis cyclic di-GMP-binding regulatory protein BcsB [Acetobacter peroxydans]MCI1394632.1 cellulose biosynthesis cyclic di-GMP-binding regulatory protein BcsB [Acetobacter peroxydans]MCI1411964.1 cellulose biosynthesis cyclic di-GMP-binding regulatory protein BcsB [Acetobacter peroxydans]MCI1439875.1 cellulose biosynthesis cyclic di-GMP-binding regulatory protein BcsB [Acetobacter peroxydans]MCI1725259.1 cellulose biosynthesis cyclic di-GMP-binding regulatory protein BcsB [Ac
MKKNSIFLASMLAAGLLAPQPGFCQLSAEQPQAAPAPATVPEPMPAPTSSTVEQGAEAAPAAAPVVPDVPEEHLRLPFSRIAPAPGDFVLRGVNTDGTAEFTVRCDKAVSAAALNLEYTPSPSLIPLLSQVKVYLNDELMGVLPITRESLGHKTRAVMQIDPMFLTDFNRVRLQFVGHYKDICENLANSTLWLDVGRNSFIDLTQHPLRLENDLAFFPAPFFDKGDTVALKIPFIFASQPGMEEETASGVLASWFGMQSQWRGQTFPIFVNRLPGGHAIVFITNARRPDFLAKYPTVSAPQLELIDNPVDKYGKILIVAGRDGHDLLVAARAIAAGNVLFTGNKLTVQHAATFTARRPYDAPAWVATDRKISFREIVSYPEQLRSSGMEPYPIQLSLNLPPDLYLLRNNSIDMKIKYRYTPSPLRDASRMTVALNGEFLQDFSLTDQSGVEKGLSLHLPVLEGLYDGQNTVHIPGLRLGSMNDLSFLFHYTNPLQGGTPENCVTAQPVPNDIVIDDTSALDFSKYYHFLAMPDLHAFVDAAFPFSRMADLSETVVVLPDQPTEAQLSLYLDVMGNIGARTGLPASNVSLARVSDKLADKDADLIMIGSIPTQLKDDRHVPVLVSAAQRWVKTPMRSSVLPLPNPDEADRRPGMETELQASGPLGAIVGFASPFVKQRSVVALLADDAKGYDLLREALNDSAKRAAVYGSVAIVRDSGVNSMRVGDIYYVGYLPWYERLWFVLSNHPILIGLLSIVGVILAALLIRKSLHILGRRRVA